METCGDRDLSLPRTWPSDYIWAAVNCIRVRSTPTGTWTTSPYSPKCLKCSRNLESSCLHWLFCSFCLFCFFSIHHGLPSFPGIAPRETPAIITQAKDRANLLLQHRDTEDNFQHLCWAQTKLHTVSTTDTVPTHSLHKEDSFNSGHWGGTLPTKTESLSEGLTTSHS